MGVGGFGICDMLQIRINEQLLAVFVRCEQFGLNGSPDT